MAIYTTSTDELSLWWVSNAKEATLGVKQTMDRAFIATMNSVSQDADDQKRNGVNGKLNALGHNRVSMSSGGMISAEISPAIVNWAARQQFGVAPTTASKTPSNIVYTHLWNEIGLPPATFSMQKQHGDELVGETLCGLAVTEITFKSSDGMGTIDIKVDGLGAGHVLDEAAPVGVVPLTTADQEPMTGAMTTCLVDGVEVGRGLFTPTWSVTITSGVGVVPGAGSVDGSRTRIDKNARRSVKATCTFYVTDESLFAQWKAKTYHAYTFRFVGPEIDDPNNLPALIEITLPKARLVGKLPSDIGNQKIKEFTLNLEAVIDDDSGNSTFGYDVTVLTQDLQHTTTV